MINNNKIINNNIINENTLNINQNQKELINKIIKIFKGGYNNNLNYNNPNQIKGLLNLINPNYSYLHQNYNIKDLFPYIKGRKIIISFIKSDNNIDNVKIPRNISKIELYSIA